MTILQTLDISIYYYLPGWILIRPNILQIRDYGFNDLLECQSFDTAPAKRKEKD